MNKNNGLLLLYFDSFGICKKYIGKLIRKYLETEFINKINNNNIKKFEGFDCSTMPDY